LALERWTALQDANGDESPDGQRRFRRRAFERARDKALIALAMTTPGRRGGSLAA
jgi:hypothetical protein